MTGKQICEEYARFKGVPEDQVPEWASRFWAMSATGELDHVFFAREEMREAKWPGLGAEENR